MSVQAGDRIRSEIGALEGMLARIPQGRVIQRAGLEGRVARLEQEVADLRAELAQLTAGSARKTNTNA